MGNGCGKMVNKVPKGAHKRNQAYTVPMQKITPLMIPLEPTALSKQFKECMSHEMQVEHYQPSILPIIPVINEHTHTLTNTSWEIIRNRHYANPLINEVPKAGHIYFYEVFFVKLFEKSYDLKEKFRDIRTQAHVMAQVIALALSIKYENTEEKTVEIKAIGINHRNLVPKPWHYDIFITALCETIKECLESDAETHVMLAWLNVFSFIMRIMLPEALTEAHILPNEGAVSSPKFVDNPEQALQIDLAMNIKIPGNFSRISSIVRHEQRNGSIFLSQNHVSMPENVHKNFEKRKTDLIHTPRSMQVNNGSLTPSFFKKISDPTASPMLLPNVPTIEVSDSLNL